MDHSSECCVISHSAYINVTGSASVPLPPPPSSLLPPFQLFSLPCRCSLCYGQGCLFAQFSDDAILSVRLMGEGTDEIKAAKLLQPSVSRARRRRVAVRAEKRRDERKRIVEFETTTTTETTTRATEERYIFVFGYGTERKRRSRLKIETLTPPPPRGSFSSRGDVKSRDRAPLALSALPSAPRKFGFLPFLCFYFLVASSSFDSLSTRI